MININSILLKSLSLAALLGCGTAFAANGTVTGKVIGYDCAHRGETCPISRLDPHLALEPDFVLLKADGDYFFMTNLPRSTKIRHVLKDVIVSGDIDDRYRNIIVKEFKVDDIIVWSQKMQDEEYQRLHGYRAGP